MPSRSSSANMSRATSANLKCLVRIGRLAVAAQIGREHAMAGNRLGEDVTPIVPASGETVEQQERGALAAVTIEQLQPVQVQVRHAAIIATCRVKKQSGSGVWYDR